MHFRGIPAFLTIALLGETLEAAPIGITQYQVVAAVVGEGCGGYAEARADLVFTPFSPMRADTSQGECQASMQAQISETANTLDLAVTSTIAHGPDMWSYGTAHLEFSFTPAEDMTFSLNGAMDASASPQFVSYGAWITEGGLSDQTIYDSRQLSASTASEHYDLGGNGGDVNGSTFWGQEAFLFPTEYTFQAGKEYNLTVSIFNSTVAGDGPSWDELYNPGAGSSVSTWNLHLETARDQIGAVPEPGTLALMGLGMAGLLVAFRRRV